MLLYIVIGEQSICALKRYTFNQNKKNAHAENDVYIKSNYCKNKMLNTNFLTDEVGIPELEELYKDSMMKKLEHFICLMNKKKNINRRKFIL